MTSLSIREARENIIQYTNSLPFPVEVKRLMFLEILSQLETVTNKEIAMQINARNEEMKNLEQDKETDAKRLRESEVELEDEQSVQSD